MGNQFFVFSSLVLGVCVLCLILLYKKRQREKAARRRDAFKERFFGAPRPAADVVEPQMGHPITPGVVPGWQSRHQCQDGFDDISQMLWHKHGATLDPEPESAPHPSLGDDNPWVAQIAEALEHRAVLSPQPRN